MANPVAKVTEGAKDIVTEPVKAFKTHPVVWAIVVGVIVVLAIRYRSTIVGWLGNAGSAGAKVRQFARS